MADKTRKDGLPRHIGLIMDGNGRWAKKRGLPRMAGHKAGAEAFKKVARYCNKLGVSYLTVFAFSTENWKRPQDEVEGILTLLRQFLSDAERYRSENIRTRFIGDLSVFDDDIRRKMADCEDGSQDFAGLTLNFAVNYGGRDEIVRAAKLLAGQVEQGVITANDFTPELFDAGLYTAGQPEVDLVIRTSGEKRLSNFLLWQTAYAEYVFPDTLFPDFDEKCLDAALEEYCARNRRFGGI